MRSPPGGRDDDAIHLRDLRRQFEPAEASPASFPICCDERQFVPPAGQRWITPEALRSGHFTTVRQQERNLLGLGIEPRFPIGQRALLLRTPSGNLLWDCIALLDPAIEEFVRGLGGLAGIAISHPYHYASMVEWARSFDCPVDLHAADRERVIRGILACMSGAGRRDACCRGALLSGDIAQVKPDRHLSFMWSYPEHLSLSRQLIERIADSVAPFAFDAV